MMTSNQPSMMTPIVYAMAEMIESSVCNDKCAMCISKFNQDKSEYNAPKASPLYVALRTHPTMMCKAASSA